MSSTVKIAPMEQNATKPASTGMSFMTKAIIGIGILAVLGGIVAIVLVVIDDGDEKTTSPLACVPLDTSTLTCGSYSEDRYLSKISVSRYTGTAMIIGPNGEVKCVGTNEFAQCGVSNETYPRLGYGTKETMNGFPKTGISSDTAIEVAMSETFSAVLLMDGTVESFGEGSLFPNDLENVASICAGSDHVGVISDTGILSVYVDDSRVVTQTDIKQVSCGCSHVMALNQNGSVSTFDTSGTSFTDLDMLPTASYVAAGCNASGIISEDSTAVYTWGSNAFGQLGHHYTFSKLSGTDVAIEDVSDIEELRVTIMPGSCASFLSMGKSHSAITMSNGYVYGFGLNAHSECMGISGQPMPAYLDVNHSLSNLDEPGLLKYRDISSSNHFTSSNIDVSIDGEYAYMDIKMTCADGSGSQDMSLQDMTTFKWPQLVYTESREVLRTLEPDVYPASLDKTTDCLGEQWTVSKVRIPIDTAFHVVFRNGMPPHTVGMTLETPIQLSGPGSGNFRVAQKVAENFDDGLRYLDVWGSNVSTSAGSSVSYEVMGRAGAARTMWIDCSSTLHVLNLLKVETFPLTDEDAFPDLDNDNEKRNAYLHDFSLQRKIDRASVGFTSTYTIGTDDNIVSYHGSADIHGNFYHMGFMNDYFIEVSKRDSFFNISTHVFSQDETERWFSISDNKINGAMMGMMEKKPFEFNSSTMFWDEQTYHEDLRMQYPDAPPMSSFSLNIVVDSQDYNVPAILPYDVCENYDETTVIKSCETSIYPRTQSPGNNPARGFIYAAALSNAILPLGFQTTYYAPDYRNGNEETVMNFLRNEFNGSHLLPNVDFEYPVVCNEQSVCPSTHSSCNVTSNNCYDPSTNETTSVCGGSCQYSCEDDPGTFTIVHAFDGSQYPGYSCSNITLQVYACNYGSVNNDAAWKRCPIACQTCTAL